MLGKQFVIIVNVGIGDGVDAIAGIYNDTYPTEQQIEEEIDKISSSVLMGVKVNYAKVEKRYVQHKPC